MLINDVSVRLSYVSAAVLLSYVSAANGSSLTLDRI